MTLTRILKFSALLLIPVLLGCASTIKKTPEIPKPIDFEPEITEIMVQEADSIEQFEEEVENENIDLLLKEARKACNKKDYAKADSILRKIVVIIEAGYEYADAEWVPVQEYLSDIVAIYSDLMPKEFPVPDEISILDLQRQILETLDTLEMSPEDSIFLARLSSKKGIVYDVPMVWNDRVKKALLFYLKSRKGVFDKWLFRAGYYLPTFKQMFSEAGLPQDLAYLPIIESAFNPHAYSRARAAGIWQFIPSTGKIYGLRQNYWLDERRDPLKATASAIRYLKKLFNDFNDWHLALGAYNCGEGGMGRAMKRDSSTNYWALSLPKETMNYVPLYLASIIVAKNPDVFDFSFNTENAFDPDTASVSDCIELATIAKGINLPLDTLAKMNPHILHWCTPPDVKDVLLYFPKGYADTFKVFYSQLPAEKKVKFYRYRIRRGDNLLQIARNFKVPVESLRTINKLRTNRIVAGHHLFIPIPVNEKAPATVAATQDESKPKKDNSSAPKGKKVSYKVRAGDTVWRISELFGVTVEEILGWNKLNSARQLKAGQILTIYKEDNESEPQQIKSSDAKNLTGKYLVKQGDNLYSISKSIGITVEELARINGLNPRRPLIFPGDILVFDEKIQKIPSSEPVKTEEKSAKADEKPINQAPEEFEIYTVQQGDNLWRIASNFGVTLDSICKHNNLTPDSVLMPGDTLKIVRGGGS